MRLFSGFPEGKVRFVSLPEQVFSDLLPIVDDLAELKLTLHVLWRLGRRRGAVRYLRYEDLAQDAVLLSGLGDDPHAALRAALTRAVERGTLLAVTTEQDGTRDTLYFANTPRGRRAVAAIERGEWPNDLRSAARPDIFSLYEENIGLLTPLIADELREAEQTYPAAWIEEAFRAAVALNKRSWKYIRAILERWRTEGKEDAVHRRSGETDWGKYLTGEYGPYLKH